MRKINLVFAAMLLFAACAKKDSNSASNIPEGSIAPSDFDYKTTKQISVNITLLTNTDEAISGVPVALYGLYHNDTINRIAIAVTNASGNINYSVSVPSYLDSFVVRPNYIGVINNVKTYLTGNQISLTLGGKQGLSGNVAGTFSTRMASGVTTNAINPRNSIGLFDINGTKTSTVFSFVSNAGADALGKPNYLEPTNDPISKDLLNNINYSLPEAQNLSKSVRGSSYLSSNATSDIVMQSKGDVYITFAYENCGNRNALGYYTYPTNNPPTKLADITNITFIFPNSSLYGSGGNLQSGNKVNLGTFDVGTTIGFVLYSDGWDASKGGANVKTGNQAFFTDSYLNPEKLTANQKHAVLLSYTDSANGNAPYELIGFEDLNREAASCDHDFNDVVYFVSTNPSSAVARNGIKPVDVAVDTDKDGVNDVLDAYPNDATKAYDTYYPGINQWGTLAFEDNWPLQGDYDLNDLVVSYRYKLVSNAQNKVVQIAADFAPIAAGANYENGLGIQLPFTSASVATVTGQKITNGYIKLNANNTEAGQPNAVIIPFDGTKQLINNPNGASFVNTDMSLNKVSGDTSHLLITTVSPVAGVDPATFNPFLISNKRRGYEVHLPGFAPTSLADKALLGTNSDASNAATGVYYVTKNNYPFALNFADGFSYPTETTSINTAYLHFFDWTLSGGKSYIDWYKNSGAGYQVNSSIYSK